MFCCFSVNYLDFVFFDKPVFLPGDSSIQYMHSIYANWVLNIGIVAIMPARMTAANESVG